MTIVQKGSPQVDEAHPDHAAKRIAGVKVGDIINNVSNSVVWTRSAGPLQFIPCSFERLYVEWTPREKGGGIVKMHQNANIVLDCSRNEKGQDVLKNGNTIVTTAYFYGLALSDGEYSPAIIGLASAQLRKSRVWLNMMNGIKLDGPNGKYTPPMFSHAYALTTTPESNEKGNWYGWMIQLHGIVNDPATAQLAAETAREKAAGRQALPAPTSAF